MGACQLHAGVGPVDVGFVKARSSIYPKWKDNEKEKEQTLHTCLLDAGVVPGDGVVKLGSGAILNPRKNVDNN
jgi:hypothetical protein